MLSSVIMILLRDLARSTYIPETRKTPCNTKSGQNTKLANNSTLSAAALLSVFVAFLTAGAPRVACADDDGRDRLDNWTNFDGSYGRVSGESWIGKSWSSAPVAISPDDKSVSFSTSLGHLSKYTEHVNNEKIEAARRLAPEGFALPKSAPGRQPRVDVWSTMSTDNTLPSSSSNLHGATGVEYKTRGDSVFGLAVSNEAPGVTDSEPNAALSPYLSLKPTRNLNLTAKANFAENAIGKDADFNSAYQRSLTTGASAKWNVGTFRFSPAASVMHGESAAASLSGTENLSKTDVKIAPKVSRPIDLGDDKTLDPFVLYEKELEIDPAAAGETTETVGAGFTFGKTGAYELGVSSRIEQGNATKKDNVKGKLELKVPLP